MKWYQSLITKITLIFVVALIGVGAILFSYANHEKHRETKRMEYFAKNAIRSSFDRETKKLDILELESFGLSFVEDKQLIQTLRSKFQRDDLKKYIRKSKNPYYKNSHHMRRLEVKAVAHRGEIYILLHPRFGEIALKTPFKKELFPTILFPIISVTLLLALYVAIIRSITPLYDLRKKVKSFAQGNLDIDSHSKNKDEIGSLANEFDTAVKKIKKLQDSRQLFLRNIMHELKTPIMKGKFFAELLEDKKQQNSLQNIFRRQESLIEEFSRIEKLTADELKLNIQEYHLEDIVDFSLDILGYDKQQLTLKLTPLNLNVDFELFGTAIKNLLSNGIAYSTDNKVLFHNTTNTLYIENKGEELEFELEKYSQPYFLEGKKQKSSRGLGFGLYITWHIIRLHDMELKYTRDGDTNIFSITI